MPSHKPAISIRRPQPEAVDRFVTGDDPVNTQTFRPPDVQVPVQVSADQGRSVVSRADGRVRRRMTLYLPPDLAKQLKVKCVTEGVDMSDVVTEILSSALGG